MEWGSKEVENLQLAFRRKWLQMKATNNTDRANFSAIWNRYLDGYGASIIRGNSSGGAKLNHFVAHTLLSNLINIVNFENGRVSGGLVLENPDRAGQYILIQRDVAERIMVLGMI